MVRILRGNKSTIAVQAGGDDFELPDSTESKAFHDDEPKEQYTAEYIKHTAILEAIKQADKACQAGQLSWHKSMRADFVSRLLNRSGYFVSMADILQAGGNRL